MNYEVQQPPFTKTIATILIINIVCFILQISANGDAFTSLFANIPSKVLHGQIWRLLTAGFLHDPSGFNHIFFNMFGLWMFGASVEYALGAKRFIQLYIFAILFSSIVSLLYIFGTPHVRVIGASGGVFALLTYYAILYPHNKILLFMIIPIKARLFVILFGLFSLGSMVVGTEDNIAHWGHLGGIGAAFLFRYYEPKVRARMAKRKRVNDTVVHYYEPRKSRQEIHAEKVEVDRILKKISRTGMSSLSEEEYQALERASGKSVPRQ